MTKWVGEFWTIDELGARVAEALSVDYAGPPNDRIRDVPDCRTIRYYTTLGLLDRPAAMRGRTALYGPRHLMQLVAIKRLQAEGQSLAEVQQRLLGLTDTALGQLARLPDKVPSPPRSAGRSRRPEPAARDAFWKQSPTDRSVDETYPRTPPAPNPSSTPMQGVAIGPGVTLLLATEGPLDVEDVEAIRRAADPLIRFLEARRLVGRPIEEGGGRDGQSAAAADR